MKKKSARSKKIKFLMRNEFTAAEKHANGTTANCLRTEINLTVILSFFFGKYFGLQTNKKVLYPLEDLR